MVGQKRSNDRRHYIFIDEFSALNNDKPADEVRDFFVRGRSRGVRLAIVVHSPEQLRKIYGEHDAAVLLGQCQNKVILRIDDIEGSEWASKALGSFHGYEWTGTIGNGMNYASEISSNWSISGAEHYIDRPYVQPDVIRSLPLASFEDGFEGYLIIPGAYGVDRCRFRLTPEWLRTAAG